MEWSEKIQRYIQELKPVKVDAVLAKRVCSLLDMTSLSATDTESSVASFCQKAQTRFGHVAAVCVYPAFARLVADNFANTPIKTATVANFPDGSSSLEDVLIEINDAIEDGAQEMDVVFPYERYLAGERHYVHTFVNTCKAACGDDVTLKIILETGALNDVPIIADAAYDVLISGADFIKSSTGKISQGATFEAVATMLLVAQHVMPQVKHAVGVKVSGGIQSLEQAAQYIELADLIMGRDWVKPGTFRIGSSKLVDELTKVN